MLDVIAIVVIVVCVIFFFGGFFVYVYYHYRATASLQQTSTQQTITTHVETDGINIPLQVIVQSNLSDHEGRLDEWNATVPFATSSTPPPTYHANPTPGEIIVGRSSAPRREPRIGQRVVRAEPEDNGIWTII